MILTDISPIADSMQIAFELIKQFLLSKYDQYKGMELCYDKGLLYAKSSKGLMPVFLSENFLHDFLQSEEVIVNIVGDPTGTIWSYIIFAHKQIKPFRVEMNFISRKEATKEGLLAGLSVLNNIYEELTKDKIYN